MESDILEPDILESDILESGTLDMGTLVESTMICTLAGNIMGVIHGEITMEGDFMDVVVTHIDEESCALIVRTMTSCEVHNIIVIYSLIGFVCSWKLGNLGIGCCDR